MFNIDKKMLVIGILFLFIGASVLPTRGSIELNGNLQDDEFEPNNSFEEAANITQGSYPGLYCGDPDWYKIYVDGGQKITVTIEFDNSNGDLDLFMYDPFQLLRNSSETTNDIEEVTYDTSFTGFYYILVKQYELDPNYYDLTIDLTSIPQFPMWNKTYGGEYDETGWSCQQTADGGFIITGDTFSYGSVFGDVWLLKTDSEGNEEWNNTWGWENPQGISYHDGGSSVQQTSDLGYIVAGTCTPDNGVYRICLIKTDSDGNEEWNKTFGGSINASCYSVDQTDDGGYILAGYTINGDTDLWLIKTDSSGDELWNKTFGGVENDYGFSVIQTSDLGYFVTGFTYSFGNGSDNWIIKTDSDGNEEWNRTFINGNGLSKGNSAQETSDGGYIIGCCVFAPGGVYRNLCLIKTDSSGYELWNTTFGKNNKSEIYGSVMVTPDQEYILAGGTWSYGAGYWDVWLIKTDTNGNEKWNRTFGGDSYEIAYSLDLTSDGGYVLCGYTSHYVGGDDDVWLIKTKDWDRPDFVYVDVDFDSSTYGWQDDCFNDIQDGIDRVSSGGTVAVFNDTYLFTNLVINKPMSLIGLNKEDTLIRGSYGAGDVILVRSDFVTIKNFYLKSNSRNNAINITTNYNTIIDNKMGDFGGIILNNSYYNTISGNDIIHWSIVLEYSNYNTITGNTITGFQHGGDDTGVSLWYSDNNTIMDNKIRWNYEGIFLQYSCNNDVVGNNLTGNDYTIFFRWYNENNTISGNKISERLNGIYLNLYNKNNLIVSNNISNLVGTGIHDGRGNNNTITGNNISECYNGVSLSYSSNDTIDGNNISYNDGDGVSLSWSDNNSIVNNYICFNQWYGLYLWRSYNNDIHDNIINNNCQISGLKQDNFGGMVVDNSSDNTINQNVFTDNNYGIYIFNLSFNNIIFHNNFFTNNHSAYDENINIWYDEISGEGNFWDDFNESNPGWPDYYAIPGGDNNDTYPLDEPYQPGGTFLRGDADGESTVSMADAIYILKHLYVPGSPTPACLDSADVDDSGDIAMSDAIFTLKYLYVPGSPAPPAPGPEICGIDPTPDALDCGYHPCMG